MTTAAPTTLATTAAPTTAAPTTSAPTTEAPTTTATTSAPTTAPPTWIPVTHSPRDSSLDKVFNCRADEYAGIPICEISISGYVQSANYRLDNLELSIAVTISGRVPTSALYRLDDLELAIETSITGWGVANEAKKNWVGWSKIGQASFKLDRVNDAGFRPMSWQGYVYKVLKLDKNVVVYGSGGVTLAYPVSNPVPTFGFKEISDIGIKNKSAVVGNEFVHFFIDILGCLYRITTEGPERLGYEEFLNPLSDPVLTYDPAEKRLFISDEDTGYVYNEGSMSGGYAGLSGLYRTRSGIELVGPEEIVADPVYLITDIIDFRRRALKSIESMQFDVESEVALQAAVDFRYKKSEEFRTTDWTPLNNEGVAHLKASGIEFRIRLKGLFHGGFRLSYISIQYKYIDQRFSRDPRHERSADVY